MQATHMPYTGPWSCFMQILKYEGVSFGYWWWRRWHCCWQRRQIPVATGTAARRPRLPAHATFPLPGRSVGFTEASRRS